MKNLVRIFGVLAIIVIAGIQLSFASGEGKRKEAKIKSSSSSALTAGMIAEEISDKMDYPAFGKKELRDATVLVEISVAEDGKITVLNTNASCKRFCAYVVDKLNSMTLENVGVERKESYSLQINFKML